MMEARKY